MIGALTGLIEELRAAGVPVSMVEAADAARALALVEPADREAVRAALGATLVKNSRHYDTFLVVFEIFFGLRDPAPPGEAQEPAPVTPAAGDGGGGGGDAGAGALRAALEAALASGDDTLLRAIARRAVEALSGIEPGRPVGGTYYLYRTMRRLRVDDLTVDDDARDGLDRRWADEELRLRIERFRAMVAEEIRRRLVMDRGPRAVAQTLRRPLVEDVDLTQATGADLKEIERIVHPLTRKLATRLSRRRTGHRGRLDVRSTLRRSLSTGGVPVDPVFRDRRRSRPELVLLADISGSVATFARFTMQFVHAVSSQFTAVRSFAFVDGVDEVSGCFSPGETFSRVMRCIEDNAQVVWLDGHSNYGNAFEVFFEQFGDSLTPRTVVVITGDARNNYHDPRAGALAAIAEQVRAVYWLNPEARRYWDTGDSVMAAYTPFCTGVHEVRTLRQLSRFVERVSLPHQTVA